MTTDDLDPTFDQRFASLENASRALSLDVQTLNGTLQVVAQLQQNQREQRERQDRADQSIVAAKQDADAREMRTRRTFGTVAVSLAILLPLISILVYGSLIQNVNQLLAEQTAELYATCLTRNDTTRLHITRERQLAQTSEDARIRVIHSDSARALEAGLIDCTTYL